MSAENLAMVWRFARPDTGFEYRRAKDHVALWGADTTLCGRRVNPNGFPTFDYFDPGVNYSCKLCAASVRKCAVTIRHSPSWSSEEKRTIVGGADPARSSRLASARTAAVGA